MAAKGKQPTKKRTISVEKGTDEDATGILHLGDLATPRKKTKFTPIIQVNAAHLSANIVTGTMGKFAKALAAAVVGPFISFLDEPRPGQATTAFI